MGLQHQPHTCFNLMVGRPPHYDIWIVQTVGENKKATVIVALFGMI